MTLFSVNVFIALATVLRDKSVLMTKVRTDFKNVRLVRFHHTVHARAKLLHKFHILVYSHNFAIPRTRNSTGQFLLCHSINQAAIRCDFQSVTKKLEYRSHQITVIVMNECVYDGFSHGNGIVHLHFFSGVKIQRYLQIVHSKACRALRNKFSAGWMSNPVLALL